jgi:hypothetical protein
MVLGSQRPRPAGHNVAHITPLHIASASHLPADHTVRRVFACAAVEGYFRNAQPPFLAKTKDTPSFATDLLREVAEVSYKLIHLPSSEWSVTCPKFVDPINGVNYSVYIRGDYE